MVIRRDNQGTFHRTLFAGITQTLTLLKRNDNFAAGTVTAYRLFDCWKGTIRKYGETIGGQGPDGDQSASHMVTWHIPTIELKRNDIEYLNNLDRIVEDSPKRYWQPEATNVIVYNLLENFFDVECLRIDPSTV